MLLDGHKIRYRVDANQMHGHRGPKTTIFADAVLALVAGAIERAASQPT